jgi:hypothetical protein
MSDIDFTLADVYSFGVIMWELLTRQQPYFGMRYCTNRRFVSEFLLLNQLTLVGELTARQPWPWR